MKHTDEIFSLLEDKHQVDVQLSTMMLGAQCTWLEPYGDQWLEPHGDQWQQLHNDEWLEPHYDQWQLPHYEWDHRSSAWSLGALCEVEVHLLEFMALMYESEEVFIRHLSRCSTVGNL